MVFRLETYNTLAYDRIFFRGAKPARFDGTEKAAVSVAHINKVRVPSAKEIAEFIVKHVSRDYTPGANPVSDRIRALIAPELAEGIERGDRESLSRLEDGCTNRINGAEFINFDTGKVSKNYFEGHSRDLINHPEHYDDFMKNGQALAWNIMMALEGSNVLLIKDRIDVERAMYRVSSRLLDSRAADAIEHIDVIYKSFSSPERNAELHYDAEQSFILSAEAALTSMARKR